MPLLALLSLTVSCRMELPSTSDLSPSEDSRFKTLDGIMVDSSNPWFSDLSEFALDGESDIKTKSSVNLVSLNSLLDLSAVEERTVGTRRLRQTPFISNCEPEYFYLSRGLPESGLLSMDSVLVSKKFLIESEDAGGSTENSAAYVVTMMADYQYCLDFGYSEISCLYHPYFTGVMIFSEPDSEFDHVSCYEGGDLYRSEFVTRFDGDCMCLTHLEVPITKDGEVETVEGGMLDDCVIKPRDFHPVQIKSYSGDYDIDGDKEQKDGSGGGGSGTGRDLSDDDNSATNAKTAEDNAKIAELIEKLQEMEIKSDTPEHERQLKETLSQMVRASVKEDGAVWRIMRKFLDGADFDGVVVTISGIGDCNIAPVKLKQTGELVGFRITYAADQPDNMRSVSHELLHVYQFQQEWGTNWMRGDSEFEARIFYCLLAVKQKFGEPNAMTEFYYNPNSSTYKAAMDFYKANYESYYTTWPPTPDSEMDFMERIKHLR